jgi:hypothetical protein
MKVGIVSESPANEAAVAIILKALIGREIEVVSSGRARNGWSGAIKAVEVELKHLHYNSDAHGIIAVVDSDDTPVHCEEHEVPGGGRGDCRVCRIMEIIRSTELGLKPRRHVKYGVQNAIGLAVPALESWLLFGRDHRVHVVEARYERDQLDGVDLKPARVQLKRDLYGTAQPSRRHETTVAIQEATRVSTILPRLEEAFPKGFKRFAQKVRSW